MNGVWADIVVILLVAIFAIVGWYKGFMKSVIGIASLVASLVLAWMLSPAVADLFIIAGLKEGIYERIAGTIGGGNAWLDGLPEAWRSAVEAGQSGAISATANMISEAIVNIIAFLTVLIVVRVLIWVAANMLNLLAKLPVINFFNRTMGLALGVIQGMLIVLILLTMVYAIMPMRENPVLAQAIENSQLTKFIYENNPITDLIGRTENITETENVYEETTAGEA